MSASEAPSRSKHVSDASLIGPEKKKQKNDKLTAFALNVMVDEREKCFNEIKADTCVHTSIKQPPHLQYSSYMDGI